MKEHVYESEDSKNKNCYSCLSNMDVQLLKKTRYAEIDRNSQFSFPLFSEVASWC